MPKDDEGKPTRLAFIRGLAIPAPDAPRNVETHFRKSANEFTFASDPPAAASAQISSEGGVMNCAHEGQGLGPVPER